MKTLSLATLSPGHPVGTPQCRTQNSRVSTELTGIRLSGAQTASSVLRNAIQKWHYISPCICPVSRRQCHLFELVLWPGLTEVSPAWPKPVAIIRGRNQYTSSLLSKPKGKVTSLASCSLSCCNARFTNTTRR